MSYVIELVFWVVLAAIAGFFGSSRREEKRVDPDKTVMRQQPALRFGMYVVGILIVGMMVFVGMQAGGDDVLWEQPMLVLLLFAGFLMGILCIGAGYVLYAKHVFFDEKELIIGRPFRSSLHVKWQEIGRMEIKKNRLFLYGTDGKKLVRADASLENYDLFAGMAKRMCSAKQIRPSNAQWKDGERTAGRGVAARIMYGFAAMLFLCVAGFGLFDKHPLVELFTEREFIILPILLLLAVGVLLYGVWLHMCKIRYTQQEITFCRPFYKKTFAWRNLRKIRRSVEGINSVEKLYLTWDEKEFVVNSAKYQQGYAELLDFVIEVALKQNVRTENL